MSWAGSFFALKIFPSRLRIWYREIRFGDGAGNTVEENSIVFSVIRMRSCLQCFDTVGWAARRASGL